MSGNYARVVGGKITPIRYTKEHLLFNSTLEQIISQGDTVIPLIESADNLTPEGMPTYRDPLPTEIAHAILTEGDITKNIYRYDIGDKVAPLDSSGDVVDEYLPDTVIRYRGSWNPDTNTPELIDGAGSISDVYQVVEGYESDRKVNLGSGLITVRSGLRMIYRDGRWRATGNMFLSDYERKLLDDIMYAQPNLDHDGQGGSEGGAFGIRTYPEVLEMLNEGLMIAQLVPVNAVKEEMLLLDDGGLTGLEFSPITGELTIDATGLPLGLYTPTFYVSSSLSKSPPIPVHIEVKEYVLRTVNEDITAPTATTINEQVVSDQDDSPKLEIVDDGGLWSVEIEDDSIVVIDTTYSTEGVYSPKFISRKSIGVSDVLTVDVEVTIPEGTEAPIWNKVDANLGGLKVIPETSKMSMRMDLVSMDSMAVDTVI